MANAVNSALHALSNPHSSPSSTIPVSSTPSNTTFVMSASSASSASPVLRRRSGKNEGYRPKIVTTVGAKPACLVNASVTYVGNDQIYAFGGFDQYTDEGLSTTTTSLHRKTADASQYTTMCYV